LPEVWDRSLQRLPPIRGRNRLRRRFYRNVIERRRTARHRTPSQSDERPGDIAISDSGLRAGTRWHRATITTPSSHSCSPELQVAGSVNGVSTRTARRPPPPPAHRNVHDCGGSGSRPQPRLRHRVRGMGVLLNQPPCTILQVVRSKRRQGCQCLLGCRPRASVGRGPRDAGPLARRVSRARVPARVRPGDGRADDRGEQRITASDPKGILSVPLGSKARLETWTTTSNPD
jgi:hypothetical protein